MLPEALRSIAPRPANSRPVLPPPPPSGIWICLSGKAVETDNDWNKSITTVDGWTPANHLGCIQTGNSRDKLPITSWRTSAIEWWLEENSFCPDTPWFLNYHKNITNTQAGMTTPIPYHTPLGRIHTLDLNRSMVMMLQRSSTEPTLPSSQDSRALQPSVWQEVAGTGLPR